MSDTLEFQEEFAFGDRNAALDKLVAGSAERYLYEYLALEAAGAPRGELEAIRDKLAKEHQYSSQLNLVRDRLRMGGFVAGDEDGAGAARDLDSKANKDAIACVASHFNSGSFSHAKEREHSSRPRESGNPSSMPEVPATPALLAQLSPGYYGHIVADSGGAQLMMSLLDRKDADFLQGANALLRQHNLSEPLTEPDTANTVARLLCFSRDHKTNSLYRHASEYHATAQRAYRCLTLEQMDGIMASEWWKTVTGPPPKPGGDREDPAAMVAPLAPFVDAYLTKLLPPDWADLSDPAPEHAAERAAYLERVARFAGVLPAAYNQLRHWINYHTLMGVVRTEGYEALASGANEVRVVDYVSLPRQHFPYPNDDYSKLVQSIPRWGAFNVNFSCLALPEPDIRQDQELLCNAVCAVFAKPKVRTIKPFDSVISDRVLNRWLATTKLLAGAEKPETWWGLLGDSDSSKRALTDRVDLEFAPFNAEYLAPTDEVALHVYLKNVPTLVVKLFELNTTAIYAADADDISTGIDLDGLVANETQTFTYTDAPLVRTLRKFDFPSVSCRRRGVWIVELIGNGRSTRALIRKGALRFTQRISVAGHHLRLLDQDNAPLPKCARPTVRMEGHVYEPDEEGEVLVPFGGSTVSRRLVITMNDDGSAEAEAESAGGAASAAGGAGGAASAGGGEGWTFSALARFRQNAESYTLTAGFHVDQEALVRGNRKATLLVRPRLLLLGTDPAPLAVLSKPELTLTSVDNEGVESNLSIPNFALYDDKESTYELAVPEGLRRLGVRLSGTVVTAATGKSISVQAERTFSTNSIDATDRLYRAFMRHTPRGYVVVVLGKSGEPCRGVSLRVRLHHRFVACDASGVSSHLTKTLDTDADGCVHLGKLEDIRRVEVSTDSSEVTGSFRESFECSVDAYEHPRERRAHEATAAEDAGEPQIEVPFSPADGSDTLAPTDACLLRIGQGGIAVADVSNRLRLRPPMLEASGLPAGDYTLHYTGPSRREHVNLKVVPAPPSHEFSARGRQLVHVPDEAQCTPLHVRIAAGGATGGVADGKHDEADGGGDEVVITVTGGLADQVRVHAFATHFVPEQTQAGGVLAGAGVEALPVTALARPSCMYLDAVTLGEENKYEIDRKSMARRAGNMLPRAGLLLTPWSVGKCATRRVDAAAGEAFESKTSSDDVDFGLRARSSMAYGRAGGAGGGGGGGGGGSAIPNLDFLPNPAVALPNLTSVRDAATDTITIRIPKADLGAGHSDVLLTVVAVDAQHSACAAEPVAFRPPGGAGDAKPDRYKPTCLLVPLDVTKHFVQSRRVSVLAAGETARIVASADTKIQDFGTLASVLKFFRSLAQARGMSADMAMLDEFAAFLPGWRGLSDADKRAKYSKYACNELNLFVFAHDAAFFTEVVAPFLRCKRAKNFIDHYVLGRNLAAYTTPRLFATLNAAERALLAGWLAGADPAGTGSGAADRNASAAAVADNLRDVVEARPVDEARIDGIFRAALASNAFEQDDLRDGLDDMNKAAEAEMMSLMLAREAQATAMYSKEAEAMRGPPMAPPPPGGDYGDLIGASAAAASAPMMMSMSDELGMMAQMREAEEDAMYDMEDDDDEDFEEEPMRETRSRARRMAAPEKKKMAKRAAKRDQSRDLARRSQVMRATTYTPMDTTEIWAETHYYKQRASAPPSIVPESEFWADFAGHVSRHGFAAGSQDESCVSGATANEAAAARLFVSPHVGLASTTATEMLMAAAVLGLPLNEPPARPERRLDGGHVVYTAAASPLVLYRKEMSATEAPPPGHTTVLVGSNFFDPSDRYRVVRGNRVDRFIENEFLRGRVYGCQVAVTNVSCASQVLDILLQIPAGCVPVRNGFTTTCKHVTLGAYTTQRIEYYFYAPTLGEFDHYGVHVSCNEELIAFNSATRVAVVDKPSREDRESWRYIARNGSTEDVVRYVQRNNMHTSDANRSYCYWRLKDAAAFAAIVDAFAAKHIYDPTMWAYAVHHATKGLTPPLLRRVREYLQHSLDGNSNGWFAPGSLGPVFASSLLAYVAEPLVGRAGGGGGMQAEVAKTALGAGAGSDPDGPDCGAGDVTRFKHGDLYEHLEYAPLVNPRAHQLGSKRQILQDDVERSYRALLRAMHYRPGPGAASGRGSSGGSGIAGALLSGMKRLVGATRPAAFAPVDANDLLAVAYHQLLQDRIEDARATFARVPPPADSVAARAAGGSSAGAASDSKGADGAGASAAVEGVPPPAYGSTWSTLQYDYMAAYLEFFSEEDAPPMSVARAVAAAYKGYPVPRWASKFAQIQAELDGMGGGAGTDTAAGGAADKADESTDGDDGSARERRLAAAAARDKLLDLDFDKDGSLIITHANLRPDGERAGVACCHTTLRFFPMDIERLFSAAPFASSGSGGGASAGERFASVRPNTVQSIIMPVEVRSADGVLTHRVALPEEFRSANVMVEVMAAGMRASKAYYSNKLRVAVKENFGRLRVTHKDTNAPLPRVYVKVYFSEVGAGADDGARFYKDGYTSLTGSFDYTSLNTDEIKRTKRFALLVTSDAHGSVVLEAKPPAGSK